MRHFEHRLQIMTGNKIAGLEAAAIVVGKSGTRQIAVPLGKFDNGATREIPSTGVNFF